MDQHSLFYVAFLGQVLLISHLLPSRVLARMRHVVKHYPPTDYPRLYPVPLEKVERAQRTYRRLNLLVLALGLVLFGLGLRNPTRDMLGWDTLSVTSLYLLLQLAPLLVATHPGFIYFNSKRRADTRTRRSAELRARRLTDFVSPFMLGAAATTYAGFVLFIAWVQRFDYPWFGGYWNIVGITLLNLAVATSIWVTLRGRRSDPYRTDADQRRITTLTVWILVLTSIAGTLSVALSIGLALLELRPFIPLVKCLYFMLVALACFRQFRIDGVDFEVYRDEPALP